MPSGQADTSAAAIPKFPDKVAQSVARAHLGGVKRVVAAILLFGSSVLAEPSLPPCIHVSAYARYGAYGYDHIVEVGNRCEHVAACVVSTNVNPDPIAVRVQPGELERVVTFRGSPAREFSANVRCKLEK
jgi:hypothetical protein